MNIETQIPAKVADTVRIAIQGVAGAFHEIAARKYQTEQTVEIVPASTFEEVIAMAQDVEMADGALMAIENSIYGQNRNLFFGASEANGFRKLKSSALHGT